jgi:hypothetical protein
MDKQEEAGKQHLWERMHCFNRLSHSQYMIKTEFEKKKSKLVKYLLHTGKIVIIDGKQMSQ